MQNVFDKNVFFFGYNLVICKCRSYLEIFGIYEFEFIFLYIGFENLIEFDEFINMESISVVFFQRDIMN